MWSLPFLRVDLPDREQSERNAELRRKLKFIAILVVCLIVSFVGMYLISLIPSKSSTSFTNRFSMEAFENIRIGANTYKVHEDLDNPRLAAETMAELNSTAKTLIYHLNRTYIDDPMGVAKIKPQYRETVINGIKSLTKNFKTANMEENIPARSGGDTSYVIDKGDVFAMCLRDPKNDNKVESPSSKNELNFVLFHEMSHLADYAAYGHNTSFWNIFRFMLQEATIAGLYRPVNYKKSTAPYCGIVISYSPLFDLDLVDYVDRV